MSEKLSLAARMQREARLEFLEAENGRLRAERDSYQAQLMFRVLDCEARLHRSESANDTLHTVLRDTEQIKRQYLDWLVIYKEAIEAIAEIFEPLSEDKTPKEIAFDAFNSATESSLAPTDPGSVGKE